MFIIFITAMALSQENSPNRSPNIDSTLSAIPNSDLEDSTRQNGKKNGKKQAAKPFELFPPFTGKRTFSYGSFGYHINYHNSHNLKLHTKNDYLMLVDEDNRLYMNELHANASEGYDNKNLDGFYFNAANLYNRAYLNKISFAFSQNESTIYTVDEDGLLLPFRLENPTIMAWQVSLDRAFKKKNWMVYTGAFLGSNNYIMDLRDYQYPDTYQRKPDIDIFGKSYGRFQSSPLLSNRQLTGGIEMGAVIFGPKRPTGNRLGIEWTGQYAVNTQDALWNQNLGLAFTL